MGAGDAPLIEVKDLWREFVAGEETVAALRDINLSIAAGEMVAIIGASGSGKSTLMNILGCLDRPTRGSYRVAGRDTSDMSADELAAMRRERFGFIFQRYHLLGHLSAQSNVEMPAIYAGVSRPDRHNRAAALLGRLGLSERLGHRPGQLSGGQQQRVSIARALMNGGTIILADEPTGALDSRSGEEVMKILRELHAEGSTIILVTHDRHVAEHADRIIEIADGVVVSDVRTAHVAQPRAAVAQRALSGMRVHAELFTEAFRIALLAMKAQRLRTFLTMLGIIIGIASVVTVVAIGEGSRQKVLADISYMGTNTVEVWVGRNWGDPRAAQTAGLQPADSDALAREPYIAAASPKVELGATARFRNIAATASIMGVSEQYFDVMGIKFAEGTGFSEASVYRRAQDVVIDQRARKTLFVQGEDPIGQIILLGTLPVRVVGVATDNPTIRNSENLVVFAPHSTVRGRMTGRTRLRSIIVKIGDGISTAAGEAAITRLMAMRRGANDFRIENSDTVRRTMESTARTMSLLISAIAVISLVVGGIGVMNIMLVSVSERTSEIGVRMAVGAPRRDILSQFLIEAILVCLLGGVLGVTLALSAGAIIERFATQFQVVYSLSAIVAAFVCSTAIGLIFGYLPARNASYLDPVQALSRE
jgi:macrolide transport system ATP-binding/permease protein